MKEKEISKLCETRLCEDLKKHNTFGVGGKADFFCLPKNREELIKLSAFCKKNEIKFKIIGNGSNILIKDGGFRGCICSVKNMNRIYLEKNIIHAECGVNLFVLNKILKENCLTGLEFSYGIPGSISGAIIQNAGAYGDEIGNYVRSVKVLENDKIENINNYWFSYRNSSFKENGDIIISASLLLKNGSYEDIEKKQKEILDKRLASQPYMEKNAGSIFKRIKTDKEEIFPAKLIDELGLKGLKIGDAEVSSIHAGFIVNKGNATAKNIIDLIALIKDKIFLEYGIILIEEIEIIGDEF